MNNRYKKNQQARKEFWKSHYYNKKTINSVTSPIRNMKSSLVQSSKPKFVLKQVTKATVTKLVAKPKHFAKPLEKTRPKCSPKSNFSKTANTSKDVKCKGKLVLEHEICSKNFETRLKKEEKKIAKKTNKQ